MAHHGYQKLSNFSSIEQKFMEFMGLSKTFSLELVVFAEFFYGTQGTDYCFDPEFTADTLAGRMRLRIKNSVHLHALHAADIVYAPTHWQASQLPPEYRHKAQVIFDGIDTTVAPALRGWRRTP